MAKRCPRCGAEVTPDPENQGKYLCYSCMRRYKESAVLDDEPESSSEDIFNQFNQGGYDDGYPEYPDDYGYGYDNSGLRDPRGGQGQRSDPRGGGRNRNAQAPEGKQGNPLGVVALIFSLFAFIGGVVALIMPVLLRVAIIPLSLACAVLGGLAVVLGLAGLIRGVSKNAAKGGAVFGMILGLLGLALGVVTFLNPILLVPSQGTSAGSGGDNTNDINVVDEDEDSSDEYSGDNDEGSYGSDSEEESDDESGSGNLESGTSSESDDEDAVTTGSDSVNSNAEEDDTATAPDAAASGDVLGTSDGTTYTNTHFGVAMTPQTPYEMADAGATEEILQQENFVASVDPNNIYGVDVGGAIINPDRNSWAAITIGQADAFSNSGTEDVGVIAEERRALLEAQAELSAQSGDPNAPTYSVTTGTVSIGGIMLPSVIVNEVYPEGSPNQNSCSIETFGANRGYIARYSAKAPDEASATALFSTFSLLPAQ